MPAASAYRRAPLVNPAYVPLSDAALHPEGTMKNRIQQVLNMVSPRHMSTLDSVLATKLGGYASCPPCPTWRPPRRFCPPIRPALWRSYGAPPCWRP